MVILTHTVCYDFFLNFFDFSGWCPGAFDHVKLLRFVNTTTGHDPGSVSRGVS
jgi:hypothetical protein